MALPVVKDACSALTAIELKEFAVWGDILDETCKFTPVKASAGVHGTIFSKIVEKP